MLETSPERTEPSTDTTRPSTSLPFVHIKKSGDGKWRAAYRRQDARQKELFRQPLPDPMAPGFQAAWEAAHAEFQRQRREPGAGRDKPQTVAAAIADFMKSADFPKNPNSARQYRHHLELIRGPFGELPMRGMDWSWVDRHRTKFADAGRAGTWNEIKKVMALVTQRFMNRHERVLAQNHWERMMRLKTPKSKQNRPWPDQIIVEVFRAATPHFRALLFVYLYTAARGSDATRFGNPEDVQFDPATRALRWIAVKTNEPMEITAPETLADLLTGPDGRNLLLTPRGVAWNPANAQETLARLRDNLGLDQYTLHGLRATVATRLAHMGFDQLVILAQGGWKDARSAKPYMAGAQQVRIQTPAAKALDDHFRPLMQAAAAGANHKRAAGPTGRAAAKAGIEGRARERRRK